MSLLTDKEIDLITHTSKSLVRLQFANTYLATLKDGLVFSWAEFPDAMVDHCRDEIGGYFVIDDWSNQKIQGMRTLSASEGYIYAGQLIKDMGV